MNQFQGATLADSAWPLQAREWADRRFCCL